MQLRFPTRKLSRWAREFRAYSGTKWRRLVPQIRDKVYLVDLFIFNIVGKIQSLWLPKSKPRTNLNELIALYLSYANHFELLSMSLKSHRKLSSGTFSKIIVYMDKKAPFTLVQQAKLRTLVEIPLEFRTTRRNAVYQYGLGIVYFSIFREMAKELHPN